MNKFFLFWVFLLYPLSLSARGHVPADTAQDDGLNAVLWQQTAVERKAANLSLYTSAQNWLDSAVRDSNWTAVIEQGKDYQTKKPAIILDIDETVLDNMSYQAWCIETGQAYASETWQNFVDSASSVPIPGALQFTQAAAQKGIEIFYVSNRKAHGETATIENLRKFGFPMADPEHVLLKAEQPDWSSAKGTRRAFLAEKYRIIMLFGDNFGDFIDDIHGGIEARLQTMNKYEEYWGKCWFMLPNPAYGSWEAAAFEDDWTKSESQRRREKHAALDSWSGP